MDAKPVCQSRVCPDQHVGLLCGAFTLNIGLYVVLLTKSLVDYSLLSADRLEAAET